MIVKQTEVVKQGSFFCFCGVSKRREVGEGEQKSWNAFSVPSSDKESELSKSKNGLNAACFGGKGGPSPLSMLSQNNMAFAKS